MLNRNLIHGLIFSCEVSWIPAQDLAGSTKWRQMQEAVAGGWGLARPYINPVAHYVYYYQSFQHQTMEGLYKFFFFSMWHKLTVDKGPLLDEP